MLQILRWPNPRIGLRARFAPLAAQAFVIALVTTAAYIASSTRVIAGWIMNSDQLGIPAFVVDVIAHPFELYGWQLPRSAYLFPDGLSYIVSYGLTRDPILALPLSIVPVLCVWLYVMRESSMLTWSVRPRSTTWWVLVVGLMLPLAISQYLPELSRFAFMYYFSFSNHFSCLVMSVLMLLWTAAWLRGQSPWHLVAIGVLLVPVAASNRAVWAFYAAPAAVIVVLCLFRRRAGADLGRLAALAGVVCVALLLGLLGEASLNRIVAQPYELTVESIARRLPKMVSDIALFAAARPEVAAFLSSVIVVYALIAVRLARASRRWFLGEMTRDEDGRFLLSVALVAGGIGNLLAASFAWENIATTRYLMFFFFAPMLLLDQVWGAVTSVYTVLVGAPLLAVLVAYSLHASANPIDPRAYAQAETKETIACITALGAHRGLAGYWTARRLTFMSMGDLRIDQLTPWKTDRKHLLFYWTNNAFSFLRGHPDIDPYDYVIVDNLDRQVVEAAFGAPDATLVCGERTIWKYRDPAHLYPRLFQGNMTPFQRLLERDSAVTIAAGTFEANTGDRAGVGMKADPDLHPRGFLAYGGDLLLAPGSYRITAEYSSDADGKGSGPSLGRLTALAHSGTVILGEEDMPFVAATGRGRTTVEIQVKQVPTMVEPRVEFLSAGRMRLHEISVARIERAGRALRITASDARAFTQVGTKEDRLLKATGQPGVLLFGPYATLPKGSYRAMVHFTQVRPDGRIGKLDIASALGKNVIAEKSFAAADLVPDGAQRRLDVDFDLSRAVDDLELRIFVEGQSLAAISHYVIVPR